MANHITIHTEFYDQLGQAITFTTDLLNHKDLNGLFYACIVFALTGTLAIKKWRALMNHNEPFSLPDVIGKLVVTLILFTIMRHPYSDDLLIVDKVTNAHQQNYQNVPTGIALPIIMYDKLTSGFDYAVDKYGSPFVPLEFGGNKVTFSLLFELDKFPMAFKAQYPNLDKSIRNYMTTCYRIGLNLGFISNTTTTGSFLDSIKYPNQFFVSDYFDKNGVHSRLSCNDTYELIKQDLIGSQIKNSFCNKLLGTSTSVNSQCDQILQRNVPTLISPNYAQPTNIIADTLIADYVTQAYAEKANRQMYTQGLMQSLMADNWLPQLQAMMLTLAIMLLPLMLIFLPYAPIKLFIWYAGLFAWLILWHGIDAIMGVQYQHELVNALKAYGDDISVDKLVSAPTEAMQVAVQYGKQRWQSMSMALTLAGVIGFSVNSAISSVAGASAQSAQSNADSSGSALGGSAGLSGAKQQMFNETTSAQAFNNVVSQSNGNQSYYDNASMQQTVSQLDAIGSAKGKLDAVKDMANVSSTSEYVAQTSTEQSIGATTASRAEAQALGVSVERMKELDSGSVLNANEAKSLNEKFGTNSFKDGMSVKDFAFTQNGEVSNLTLSGAGAKGTESYTIDNKGDVVQSKIDGTKQDLQGSTYINKNTVDVGSSYSQGSEFNVRAGTIQKTLEGVKDNETLSPIKASMSNEEYKSQYINQTTDQLSKEMTVEKSESGQWQVSVGGGVGKMLSLEANANAQEAMKYAKDELRSEVASTFDNAKSANDVVDNLHNLENKIQGKSVGDMGEKVVNGYDTTKQVASDIVNNAGKGTSNVDGTQSYYQPTNNSNGNDYHDRSLVDDVKHIGSEIVSEAKSFIGTDAEQTDKKVVSAVANQQQNSNEQDSKAMSTIGTTANELHKSAQQRTAINEAKQGLEKLDATVIDNAKKNK